MTAHRSSEGRSSGDGPESTAQSSLSRRSLLAGSAVGIASLSGCLGGDIGLVAGKRDESSATYDLQAGTLRVDATHGNVTVREGSDAVEVRTIKTGSLLSTLSAVSVTSERDGDTVRVRSRADGDPWFLASIPEVDIQIDVPPGVTVEAMALQNGNARVQGVSVAEGTAIQTENGNVTARRIDGDLTIETENGNAEAADVAGFVGGRSENGNVEIRDCDGIGDTWTANGNVEVAVPAIRGDTSVRSENGNVEASLGSGLDAQITARTTNGNVDVDGLDAVAKKGQNYAEGTLGEGSNDLDLETENGNVSLSRLS